MLGKQKKMQQKYSFWLFLHFLQNRHVWTLYIWSGKMYQNLILVNYHLSSQARGCGHCGPQCLGLCLTVHKKAIGFPAWSSGCHNNRMATLVSSSCCIVNTSEVTPSGDKKDFTDSLRHALLPWGVSHDWAWLGSSCCWQTYQASRWDMEVLFLSKGLKPMVSLTGSDTSNCRYLVAMWLYYTEKINDAK